jgi:outer membrane protein assembly factor BamB
MIVVGDFDGYLHWLSQEDGRLLARTRVGSDAIRLKPLVMNDIVFVLDEGGTLSALKAFPIDTESR